MTKLKFATRCILLPILMAGWAVVIGVGELVRLISRN